MDGEACAHRPVYFGVTNINVDEHTIGSVDVWRCAACRRIFCEEKQLGIEALAESVGMPRIDHGMRWAVCVCQLQAGRDKWRLVRMPESGTIRHECIDEHVVELEVDGYRVRDGRHWSFLVDENVNKAVEIGHAP